MLESGTDPESRINDYTVVYEHKLTVHLLLNESNKGPNLTKTELEEARSDRPHGGLRGVRWLEISSVT